MRLSTQLERLNSWRCRYREGKVLSGLSVSRPLLSRIADCRHRVALSGMSGINLLGRLLLPLGRHFGGVRFSEHSARPELIPLDIIFGQARFAVVELSSRTVFQI